MVKINGVMHDIDGTVVKDFLLRSDYNLTRIAVELNGDILPKSQYGETVLKDGDSLEVVNFVGGG